MPTSSDLNFEQAQQSAVIVNSPSGAIEGEILVKFRSSASDMLDAAAPVTRSGRVMMTRSGIEKVDVTLDAISSTQLQRVFPVAVNREEITRTNNLHLWYVIRFDQSHDLTEVATQLAALPQVEIVEYSRTITPVYDRNRRAIPLRGETTFTAKSAGAAATARFNDPNFAKQWNLKNDGSVPSLNSAVGADINAEEAWEIETGDPSIIVAVLDEGIMYTHPDLAANMWVNPDEEIASSTDADGNGYAGDRHGYNFVFDKGIITHNQSGDSGHGTHVAGLVSAVNNNGEGISSIAGGSGVNDGVKIMSCQIIDGYNVVTLYEEAQAIKYAADNGAVILQCSWGINSGAASYPTTSGYESDEEWMAGSALEKDALDYFIHNAGSPSGVIDGGIAIFAGGNEYASMVGYPSRYGDYISVAALAADNSPASYTNYESRVGISAPGGDMDYHLSEEGSILSTMPPLFDNDYSYYGYMDGTSMACPQVSGVVALALSRAQKLRKHYKAEAFIDLVKKSGRSIEEQLIGYKTYCLYFDYAGDKNVEKVSLSRYAGKMGAGAIDARALLDLVGDESTGAAMRIPNYTIALGGSATDDLSKYFISGGSNYSASVTSSQIATATTNGSILSLQAVAVGSTTVKITSDGGVDQMITVIVRSSDAGWL
ncbi:MAG: S8 family serine peptidase [Rikenellaceae bacterium]